MRGGQVNLRMLDHDEMIIRKRASRVSAQNPYNDHFNSFNVDGRNRQMISEEFGDGGVSSVNLAMDGTGFRCITCNRGPPYTKKYAKNQCQTCYKKDKKFQRSTAPMGNGNGQHMHSQIGNYPQW